jgi:hypothetical protein
MNRTIKEATAKRYHYETHDWLKEHLVQFLAAYNFARRLKTLRGLTPYEYISKCRQKEPERFRLNPHHHILGLNTWKPSKAIRLRSGEVETVQVHYFVPRRHEVVQELLL